MNKLVLGNIKKLLIYLTIPTIILTSCGKKAECDYPNSHAHLYKKTYNQKGIDGNNITVEKYLMKENLTVGDYERQEDLIELNEDDELFMKKIQSHLRIKDNWPYLYDKMKKFKDYLEFEYEYTKTETYTETDSDGNTVTHTRTKTCYDWHRDPYDSDNTGLARVVHQKMYGGKLVQKTSTGKDPDSKKITIKFETSKLVDDIREVADEYPYFVEVVTVSHQFRRSPSQLRYLDPYDPSINPYNHPRLDITSLDWNQTAESANPENYFNPNLTIENPSPENYFNPNLTIENPSPDEYFNPNTIR